MRYALINNYSDRNRIYNRRIMLPYRNNRDSQSGKRKTKEGDWVCIRCANYNYSFRSICNRCRAQSKDENHTTFVMLTNDNYGENSFPSALFLKLDPLKARDTGFPMIRDAAERGEKGEKGDEGLALKQNKWINNLINQ